MNLRYTLIHRSARGLWLAGLLAGGAAWAGLKTPFPITAKGQPIDVEIGHAAPWVADFNGDQKPDLLVGQFRGGKLRLYPNMGTARAPRFTTFAWFRAGGTIPHRTVATRNDPAPDGRRPRGSYGLRFTNP